MPVVIGLTLVDAVSEVLARCGQLDEDVSNPNLDAEARRHINAAQRQLRVEHAWLRQRRSAILAFGPGQRFADMPPDARQGQLTEAWWCDQGNRLPVAAGIDRGFQSTRTCRYPGSYDFAATQGIVRVDVTDGGINYTTASVITQAGGVRGDGGHAPAFALTVAGGLITACTVLDSGSAWLTAPTLTPDIGTTAVLTAVVGPTQVIEIMPAPTGGGQLEINYRAEVVPLVEDTDRLALDDEAVIGRAAWLLATIKRLAFAKDILTAHSAYLDALRRQQGVGKVTSLSAWRRDAQATALVGRWYR